MKRTQEEAFRDEEDEDPKEDQSGAPTWPRRLKAVKISKDDVAGQQPSEAKETEDGTPGAAQQPSDATADDAGADQQVADEGEKNGDGLPQRSRSSLRKARRNSLEAAKIKRKEKQKLRKRKQRAKKRSLKAASVKEKAAAEAEQRAKSRLFASDWEEQPSYLTQLPVELLFLVIVFMKPKHALMLSHVCRELRSKIIGMPWRQWYYQRWPCREPVSDNSHHPDEWFRWFHERRCLMKINAPCYEIRRNNPSNKLLIRQWKRINDGYRIYIDRFRERRHPVFFQLVRTLCIRRLYIFEKPAQRGIRRWINEIILYSPVTGLPLYLCYKRLNKKGHKMFFYYGGVPLEEVTTRRVTKRFSREEGEHRLYEMMEYLFGKRHGIRAGAMNVFLEIIMNYHTSKHALVNGVPLLTCFPEWTKV